MDFIAKLFQAVGVLYHYMAHSTGRTEKCASKMPMQHNWKQITPEKRMLRIFSLNFTLYENKYRFWSLKERLCSLFTVGLLSWFHDLHQIQTQTLTFGLQVYETSCIDWSVILHRNLLVSLQCAKRCSIFLNSLQRKQNGWGFRPLWYTASLFP